MYRFDGSAPGMPVLREQIEVSQEPVLRLSAPDEEETGSFRTEDSMSATLGLKVSASLYEVWSAADMWHMAGGGSRPLDSVSRRVGREVDAREFARAVANAVNEVIGYDGCRPLGKDRIRADGSETVAIIVDGLLAKQQGHRLRRSVIASLKGE